MSEQEDDNWNIEIRPHSGLFDLRLGELWKSRDILKNFVKRDFVAVYKQTVLGPLWFFIQPILTTLMFTFLFGTVAKIPTDGIPPMLFYLSGIVAWNYFASCLTQTSNVFIQNAQIFGKVYFYRLTIPLSVIVSALIKFGIQFMLFLAIWAYYLVFSDYNLQPTFGLAIVPYLIFLMALLGLGFGLIISSMTTKYRDLAFLIQFGVQLAMYATPVIYPLSMMKGKALTVILANPMTAIIESFKFAFLGAGSMVPEHLLYSTCFTLVTLFIGVIMFNRVEKSFVDTV